MELIFKFQVVPNPIHIDRQAYVKKKLLFILQNLLCIHIEFYPSDNFLFR